MKKMNLIGLVISVLLATGLSAATTVKPEKLSKVQLEKIQGEIPLFSHRNINLKKGFYLKKEGLYELKTVLNTPRGSVSIPAFVDKKSHVIFVGSAYFPNGKKINMPVNRKIVNNGVAFTYGSGKKGVLYLFTDPQCPFCRALERREGKVLDNYTVHTVIFPLSFHQYSKPMTEWILRGKTSAEKIKRFKEVLHGSNKWAKAIGFNLKNYNQEYRNYLLVLNTYGTVVKNQELKKRIEVAKKRYFTSDKELANFKNYLERSAKAFREVGAKGTPTLTNKNFQPINPRTLNR